MELSFYKKVTGKEGRDVNSAREVVNTKTKTEVAKLYTQ